MRLIQRREPTSRCAAEGAGRFPVSEKRTACTRELVRFEPEPQSKAMEELRSRPLGALVRTGYRELFKESRQAVHPAAIAWLEHNCLMRAAEEERANRQRRRKLGRNGSTASCRHSSPARFLRIQETLRAASALCEG